MNQIVSSCWGDRKLKTIMIQFGNRVKCTVLWDYVWYSSDFMLLWNRSPQNNTKLLSHNFCGSKVWAWHHCIFCAWSYLPEIKVSDCVSCEAGGSLPRWLVVGRIHSHEVVGLVPYVLLAVSCNSLFPPRGLSHLFSLWPLPSSRQQWHLKTPLCFKFLTPLLQPARENFAFFFF